MAVTSFEDIKAMSGAFRAMLNTSSASVPFDAANTQMVILVDVATDLQTILKNDPAKLALIIGMQKERLTVCLLGADANGKPLRGSVSGGAELAGSSLGGGDELPGEEAWPDEETITNSENNEYDAFFGNP